MTHPVISADSPVTEPPEAWHDIDPAFRDRAPRVQHVDRMGNIYVMLAEHGATLSEEQRRAILCENAAELYRIDLGALA